MEDILLYSLLCIFLLFIVLIQTRKQYKNLPPSPFALPIIGHLHLIKQPIYKSLHNLSRKYSPIIYLRVGSHFATVVSSPSAVEECFTKNDIVLAERPQIFLNAKYLHYNNTTLLVANYGDHWRNLRRICAIEIFSSNRLNKFLGIRKDEIKIFLCRLYHASSHGFAKVELRSMFNDLTSNTIARMVAGKCYYGEDMQENRETMQFREIVKEFMECSMVTKMEDLFPVLQCIDYGGYVKRLVRLSEKIDLFFQRLIDEQRHDRDGETMITHLLSLQESHPDYYTDEIIKGLILVMFIGGTESSATSLEWAISNLLNHPDVLKKAEIELDTQVGCDHLIDETDFPKLLYLQNIVSENLRLYPVVPVIVRMSSNYCTIGGYDIPPHTMLFVNVWDIHRNPELWGDDSTSFKPERFENRGGETHNKYLMPFGLGRRACPGDILATRMMTLTLGSLIQCFEWERVDGKKIDMAEKTGMTLCKVKPLEVMCKARPSIDELLIS